MPIDDIATLNLGPIAARAAVTYHWTASPNDVICWYKSFLRVVFKQGTCEAISKMADQLWHEYITYTVQYRADMLKVFGKFLDHIPIDNPLPTPKYAADKAAYEQECMAFCGKIPPDVVHICHT
jgi:hypothetical protein